MSRDFKAWSRLEKKLVVDCPASRRRLWPSDGDICEFEKKHLFKFPASYISFITHFGGGNLNSYFNVFAPLYGERQRDLEKLYKQAVGNQVLINAYGKSQLINRMVPFADTIGGDIFVWDPTAVTNRQMHEYSILALERDYRRIYQLADSFQEFICDVCFGFRFFDVVIGERDPEWKITYRFIPNSKEQASRRRKSK